MTNEEIGKIIQSALFFRPCDNVIEVFTEKQKLGYSGYKVEIEYTHDKGYSWDASPFFAGNAVIEKHFDSLTTDKKVIQTLGGCPVCNRELFSCFSWELHDVSTHLKKKAVAIL
jgi:hypothetical protein